MSSLFKSKQLNLIIGVDTFNNCLRVMQIVGNDVSTCKVDYLSVDPDLVIRGEWETIFGETLKEFIEQMNFDKSFAVKLVLPDRLVGTDIFTVPTLSRAKMEDVLQTQMKELYFFYSNYKYNKYMLATNKTNSTYQVYMINKDVLNGIYKSLSSNRLYVKNASYSASCALNAVYALRPKTRKTSFLFLDIKEMNSKISIAGNGNTLGWVDIPFGLNVLENDKVLFENNVIYNDVANIAVINATEIARKKKMTVMGEEEDDSSIIEDSAISVNDLSASETNMDGTTTVVSGEAGEEIVVHVEPESGDNALAVPTDVVVVEPEEVKPKKKTYARKIKRVPAFMQRPIPEDELGFMAENFRMFVKRVLLVKMHHEQNAHLPNPQYVLVNMPKEYAGILDIINQEEDNGIEFRYFNPETENNRFLTGNLDLYGALFTETYNKQNNF